MSADLRVQVTAPDGRQAQVLVSDDGGTVRVAVPRRADLRVVAASLPGGLSGVVTQLVRLARRGALPLPPWDQPVEVSVGGTVVLRRRGGRWSAGSRPAASTLAAVGGAVVAVGVAVVVAGRLRRR